MTRAVQSTRRALYLSVAAAAVLLGSESALAQESSAESAGQGGEIIVTAQRREQSVQATPVAVTAVSGEALSSRGVQNVNDLVGIVPGFAVRDAGQSYQYNLRGYISTDGRANTDGPVAVYVDDVFLGATVMQLMQGLDVSRVEALRGPQGTLFGRNAVGGLVHYVSNSPKDEFGGYLRLQAGQYGEVIGEGAVNVPISSGTAVRLALKYNRNDGWQKNRMGGKNRDAKDALAGRVQLRSELTDRLRMNLSFQFDRERNQYQGFTSLGAMNAVGTSVCSYAEITASQCFLGGAPFSNVAAGTPSLAKLDPKNIYSTLASNPDNYDAQLAIGRFDWDLDENLKLTSITSWAHAERSFVEDDNATGIAANDFFNLLQHAMDGQQFSQELRVGGKIGGADFVLGGYYLTSTKNDFYAFLTPNASAVMAYAYPRERIKTETAAAFGQLEIPVTEQLRFIAGGRYTWERKGSRRLNQAGFLNLGPVVELPKSTGSVSRFTGKLGFQWSPSEDLTIYGHYSSGFKSGEFPSVDENAPLQLVKPETIDAFELGLKSQFLDRRITFNVALYANEIKNKQSVTTVATSLGQRALFVNFGRIVQKGVEAELVARPTDAITLSGTIAYTDNTVRSNVGTTVQRLATFQSFPLDGNELPGVPPFQATLSGDLALPVGLPGNLVFGVSWRWQSKVYWNLSNNEVEIQPANNVGNLRLTYSSPTESWSLGAFVNNVTDTKVQNVNFSFGGSDVLTIQWARPRWAGVRGSINF